MSSFLILPKVILRTPLFSYSAYETPVSQEILFDPIFRAALYFASPNFYHLLAGKKFLIELLNEKELFSINKYLNRMCYRPIPFGLFSSFTLLSWGKGEQAVLSPIADLKIHIGADQELSVLAGEVRENESTDGYLINPTLYRLGNEYRFIKSFTQQKSTKLKFIIESIDVNPLTKKLVLQLQNHKMKPSEIIDFLQGITGCGQNEAADYFRFLKDVQVIKSVGGPNITGPDYYKKISPAAEQSFPPIPDMITIDNKIGKEHLNPSINSVLQFQATITKNVAALGLGVPERLLYVNTERPLTEGSLNSSYQEPLLSAINALAALSEQPKNPLLEKFIKDFKQRFEGRSIPLLQALDPDAGVGYGSLAVVTSISPLLKNIHFKNHKKPIPDVEWSPVHQLLLRKWNDLNQGIGTISLNSAELESLSNSATAKFPASIPVVFRVVQGKLFVENAGGATGTSLIGRFTPFSKEIEDFSRAIALHEMKTNAGVTFADILQLSDHHVDNVNRRISPYDFEIPVNCISLLPNEQQIKLTDLVVSVKNDEVILESVKLKRRIIPRLSSAFNYRHNQLSIFQFLCDLQYQSLNSQLSVDLEIFFPGMPFYPRLEFEGTILALAKWHLSDDEIRLIKNNLNDESQSELKKLRENLKLPSLIAITNADQQLVFDLDDAGQSRFFSSCVATLSEVTILEYLLPLTEDPTLLAENQPHVNQFMTVLLNKQAVYKASDFKPKINSKIDREFILGTSWLYFKIYCTPQATDDILIKKILPVISILEDFPLLTWFFVRYADPENHIRLRIKVTEEHTNKVLVLLRNRFSGLVRNAIVRDYLADTYRRELERYGPDIIIVIEEFFRASSDLSIHFIKNNQLVKVNSSVQFLALSSMETLLERLLPDIGDQLEFLEFSVNGFFTEFGVEKKQRLELDKLYRTLRPQFLQLSHAEDIYKKLKLTRQVKAFIGKVEQLRISIATFSKKRRFQLTADLIHMHLNRIFSERQREQETITYYCFRKHKESAIFRNEK